MDDENKALEPDRELWEKIEESYVNLGMSCRVLAEIYGVERRQVERRCREGSWVSKRKEARKKAEGGEARAAARLDVQRLSRELESNDKLGELIAQVLELMLSADEEEKLNFINQMDGIATTQRKCVGVWRDLLKMPGYQEDVRLRQERIRLQEEMLAEKKRMNDAMLARNETGGEVKMVIEGDEEMAK